MAVSKKVKRDSRRDSHGQGQAVQDQETRCKSSAKKRVAGSGTLVVVESPAKAATIKKYLGAGYVVKASVGHVKDLPKASMGIDVKHDFQPEYVVIEGKRKVIADIKAAAKKAGQVLLAPDPDREGEAIAWHIAEEIRPANPNIQRVLFNEITKKAVNEAILHPRALDLHKFESQQARRVLDRLVGYEISPVLWSKVRRGLSAGRVQSVAVRLVVDREAEIKAFRPEEYWTIAVEVEGSAPPPFTARVVRLDGEKAVLSHEGQASEVVALLSQASLRVAAVERKERRKNPPPPFITSRLQQEASSKLRFSPKRTMSLAQRLYEGIELGDEGPTGLITYMRTDSTRLSEDAVKDVRAWIADRYGEASLPAEPNVFKSKKSAQDAHEAIRPTSTQYDPETVRRLLSQSADVRGARETEDLVKLYTLIWNRFVACQMMPAVFDQTVIEIDAGRVGLRATGQVMRFAGYLAIYAEAQDDASPDDESTGSLPDIHPDETLRLLGCQPEQHFTQPPPRFSEATLVRELEEKGIGRPSTYATILSTIQDRGYVEKKEGRLGPTELGVVVNGLLVTSFPEIVSSDFTALMEEQLDEVEEGAVDWVKLLRDFYEPFEQDLARAKVEMRDLKREEEADPRSVRKVRQAHGDQVGPQRLFPGVFRFPRVSQHQGVHAQRGRHPDGSARHATVGPDLPKLQLAHGHPARTLRRVSRVFALPGLQDHQRDFPRRRMPPSWLRRVFDREAFTAGEDLLWLFQLLQDQVRLRVVGPSRGQALPAVWRRLRGAEGVACGRAPALPGPGLRLDGRARRGRGWCSRARRQGVVDQRGWPDQDEPPRAAAE